MTTFISLESQGDVDRVILGGKGRDFQNNFFSGHIASLEIYVSNRQPLPDAIKYSIMKVICKEYDVASDA